MQESATKDKSGNSSAQTENEKKTVKAPGLEGVVALESELSFIDGQKGELIYRGYDINDLAQKATFEEVVYLMWNGELPNQQQLDELNEQLRAQREVAPSVLEILRQFPDDANPMAALRTAVSSLGLFDEEADEKSPESNYRKAIRLVAKIPTVIAAFDRLRKGKEPVAPLSDHSTAYNFLYMLNDEEPGEAAEETFDVCLVLHADHGLNASTFTARVVGSTLSDMYSAVTGAVGALKGPLHGGANIEVMKMLKEIDGSQKDPVQYVQDMLANGERVMGFGHRVYKVLDPRAAILREMVEELSEEKNARKWYDISSKIMDTVVEEKGLYPNVDFFSASVYYMLGIDIDIFTPIFAMSRTAGWTAHLLEQWENNRLIRPRAEYVGPRGRTVEPVEQR